jgi:hypothetical protein
MIESNGADDRLIWMPAWEKLDLSARRYMVTGGRAP